MKKLKIQSNGRPDNFQTPKIALDIFVTLFEKRVGYLGTCMGKRK